MSFVAHSGNARSLSFFDHFLNLNCRHSLGHLISVNVALPLKLTMNEGIKNHPLMARVGAPLLAIPFGLAMVAVGVSYFAEGVFKELANLFLAVVAFDKKGAKAAAIDVVGSAAMGVVISVLGIVSATIGTVGLIVDPNWAYKNVIDFGNVEKNK